MTGLPGARAEDAVAWVSALVTDLRIPRLSTYGLSEMLIPTVIERAQVASSTRTNPIALAPGELAEIIERAL